MREGWKEIDPRVKGMEKRKRRPYVVLRPKEGKIYFSYRLVNEYLTGSRGVIVRYNRELNMLSFLPSDNGERSYKLSERGTIAARNLFSIIKVKMRSKKAYYVKYNKQVRWLEICLDRSDEGDMRWLKA